MFNYYLAFARYYLNELKDIGSLLKRITINPPYKVRIRKVGTNKYIEPTQGMNISILRNVDFRYKPLPLVSLRPLPARERAIHAFLNPPPSLVAHISSLQKAKDDLSESNLDVNLDVVIKSLPTRTIEEAMTDIARRRSHRLSNTIR